MRFRSLPFDCLLSLLLHLSTSTPCVHGNNHCDGNHCGDGLDYPDHRYYNRKWFDAKLEEAMNDVKQILNTTRHPVIASSEDREHSYDDKYALVEMVTNSFIASVTNIMNQFGVPSSTVIDWVRNDKRSVVLRFSMYQKVHYVKQTKRNTGMTLGNSPLENSHDHHFKLATPYKLELLKGGGGGDDGETILLKHRDDIAKPVIVVGGKDRVPPPPYTNDSERIDLDITWVVQKLVSPEGGSRSPFSIDRLSSKCKTPRRNPEIDEVWAFVDKLKPWSIHLLDLLTRHEPTVLSVVKHHSDKIFRPVVPLFENHEALDQETVGTFVQKHEESLNEARESISNLYREKNFVTDNEVNMALLAEQLLALRRWWHFSVSHVEEMLHTQLEEAIGKRVTPKDFQEFIEFHAHQMFGDEFVPKPFAYAIRRENNYPDGMLSLEVGSHDDPYRSRQREHVQTTVRRIPAGDSRPPISIPLNTATSVEIQGDCFLHGWLQNQWAGRDVPEHKFLVARAHQFSSFLLVIGQMRGPNNFVPKKAIILQNKDEVIVPLSTFVLPSAKEFKDSIASLSPEQQEFAKAFREMQLGSSVLGICVIQIKPQLERLLNLPVGALTKEIRLTQDLMNLFVDYQIPSDFLSYDGVPDAAVSEKVDSVKEYVKAVANVIDDLKEKQLKDEKMKKDMRENTEPIAASSNSNSRFGGDYRYVPTSIASDSSEVDPRKSVGDSINESGGNTRSKDRGKRKFSHGIEKSRNVDADFTLLPNILDERIEKEDKDGALKSTIITPKSYFWRSRQANLLEAPEKSMITSSRVEDEKGKAIDLLTAISRSGSLPINASELHVVIGMTHCFTKQIMETIIQDNINPIEKVEKSLLMIASVIHNKPSVSDLLPKDTKESTCLVDPEIVAEEEAAA